MSDVDKLLPEIRAATDRVESAIAEATRTVEKVVRDRNLASFLAPLLPAAVAILLISAFGEAWHSKWRYQIQYGVGASKLSYEKRPHTVSF